jgi:hypothetical protein
LGGENGGDEQFPGRAVGEGALDVGIGFVQPLEDCGDAVQGKVAVDRAASGLWPGGLQLGFSRCCALGSGHHSECIAVSSRDGFDIGRTFGGDIEEMVPTASFVMEKGIEMCVRIPRKMFQKVRFSVKAKEPSLAV